MNVFWAILGVVNLLLIGGLIFIFTRKTEDAMSNAMGGAIFWGCIIALVALDCLTLLIRWLARVL